MKPKQIITSILFILSLIFYYQITIPTQNLSTTQVTKVIDGDTLKTNESQTIRLLGINTPEKNQPFYQEAKQALLILTQNKTIKIQTPGQDKYKRTLAYIFIKNQNINAQLLRQGLATLYYYDHDSHYEELKKAEEFARKNQLAIWKPSPNQNCITIQDFKTTEPEHLVLKNSCNFDLNITYKDDATHIYKATIKQNSQYQKNFSHIWNTDGDSIYIYDNKGLILFYRYS